MNPEALDQAVRCNMQRVRRDMALWAQHGSRSPISVETEDLIRISYWRIMSNRREQNAKSVPDRTSYGSPDGYTPQTA